MDAVQKIPHTAVLGTHNSGDAARLGGVRVQKMRRGARNAPADIRRRVRRRVCAHVGRPAPHGAPQAVRAGPRDDARVQKPRRGREIHGKAQQGAAQPVRVRPRSARTVHEQRGGARPARDSRAPEDTRRHQGQGYHGMDGQPVLVRFDMEKPRTRLPPRDCKVRLDGTNQVNTYYKTRCSLCCL